MTTETTRYQFVEVKTVRGAEQRSIAKKQAEGWELVSRALSRFTFAGVKS